MAELLIKAPLYGSSGYATAARHFIWAVANQTTDKILLEPLKWISGFPVGERPDMLVGLKALERTSDLNRANATLLHWTVAEEYLGRQGCQRAIGHTTFETNTLLRSFVEGCNRMDYLIVPTAFNQLAFVQAGVKIPIQVIPEGVDSSWFTPEGPILKQVPPRFTFLVVGQLNYRKGIDLAINAFLDVFGQRDDVQLLLRCHVNMGKPADLDQIRAFVKVLRENYRAGFEGGNLLVVDSVYDLHLPALYRSAQVLLAPFRGEGWGLPLIEALSCEVPVIATHWSGPTAYLQPDMASLLDYQLKPIPSNVPDYFLGRHLVMAREEGHLLAEPDFEQLKAAMWEMYQNYFVYKAQAIQARQYLQQHFQWQHAAAQFLQWMESIS